MYGGGPGNGVIPEVGGITDPPVGVGDTTDPGASDTPIGVGGITDPPVRASGTTDLVGVGGTTDPPV